MKINFNDEDYTVTYLSDNIKYVLLTKNTDINCGLFMVNLIDLPEYQQQIINKFIQFKKPGSY